MKAITWHGKRDVRVDSVPDPSIEEPTDAIVRITSTCICGSDLPSTRSIQPARSALAALASDRAGDPRMPPRACRDGVASPA